MSSRNTRASVRLKVECLEGRDVPTVTSVFLSGSTLVVQSNDVATRASINFDGFFYSVKDQSSATPVTWFGYGPATVSSVEFRGGAKADDFRNNVANLQCFLYGNGGDDYLEGYNADDFLFGGAGKDTLVGYGGADYMDGGSENDTLRGLAGRDWMIGGAGDDRLEGGSENDTLYGRDNRDVLLGQQGDDRLYGEAGDDQLIGGTGYDRLYGDAGNDMLLGGANDGHDDLLNGGTGADRFLVSATRPAGLRFIVREDTISDFSTVEDARPTFLNGWTVTVTHSPTETNTYTGRNWTDTDVLRVDAVLDVLHREARGTALLKNGSGDLVFMRHGTTFRGYNDGYIHMTDAPLQFGGTDTDLRGYLLHEIGHNWQGNAFRSKGTDYWTRFINISRWTSTEPSSLFLYRVSTNEGRGNRWYLKTATFASNYARTNEDEDFAESFAAYFTQRAGWTFYAGGAGAAAIPAKMALFTSWVAGL